MHTPRPVPVDVVQSVEGYVDSELADAAKYDNRQPLDESGVYSLHVLVAAAYGRGFADGEHAQAARALGRRARERT